MCLGVFNVLSVLTVGSAQMIICYCLDRYFYFWHFCHQSLFYIDPKHQIIGVVYKFRTEKILYPILTTLNDVKNKTVSFICGLFNDVSVVQIVWCQMVNK
jgi:hypothetical protein